MSPNLGEVLMSKQGQACPSFENPPVIETVLSVQFEALQAFSTVHFGLFWEKVRNRFPETKDHPALPPAIEQQQDSASVARMRFEAVDSLTPQRLWLLNQPNTEMIQVQNDRFVKNWRSIKGNKYPRYVDSIKPIFERDFKEFKNFIENEELGEIKVNQCEVTYVNHIVSGEGWDNFDEFEKIFTTWKQADVNEFPGRADDYTWRSRYPILDSKKEWIGRLYVDVQPALRVGDNKPMYVMNLTARGMCGNSFDFFDIGHEAIVKSFKNLTTLNMHKIWKEK